MKPETQPGVPSRAAVAAVLALAALGAAAAAYLIPASAHLVSWSPGPTGGPAIIALLPPRSRLWSSLALSGGIVAVAFAVGQAAGLDRRRLVGAAAPITLLLLWAVPFVPGLARRAPLLLLLAGPLRWAVAALAVGGALTALVPHTRRRPEEASAAAAARVALPLVRASAFVIGFALYAWFGFQHVSGVGPGLSGDEPHYLVIAHSLLVDHDLDIANNHARRDYRAFYPGDLVPDFLRSGVHGEIYSIHAPGLPMVILPAYRIGGVRGAILMVALIAALTSLAIFDLAVLIAGHTAAIVTWAAVCLTVPFVPHAWLIYPEIAGALIVAWSVRWLWQGPWPTGLPIVRGAALGLLPWLHTKFLVLLVPLTLFQVVRLWPRFRQIASLVVPVAVSTLLWLYSFYRMYGVLDPEAPYGGYMRLYVHAENIPRGVLGLLVDQKFGLLVYSPVYLLAAIGAWFMLRDPKTRLYGLAIGAMAIAFVVSTTRLYMWWGGSSAPARFLVPILPLAAPMIAVAIQRLRGAAGRALVATTVAASLGVSIFGVAFAREQVLFSHPHGVAALAQAVEGSAPLDAALPTFTEEGWHAPFALLVRWLAALVIAGAALGVLLRTRVVRSGFWAAAAGITAFGLFGSAAFARWAPADPSPAALRGQLSLIREFDHDRLRAVDLSRWRRMNDGQLIAAATISTTPGSRLDLPEGDYEARVTFHDGGPPHGEKTAERTGQVFVALSRQVQAVSLAASGANPLALPFTLWFDSPAAIDFSDAGTASAVRRIDVVPRRLVPRSARSGLSVVTAERLTWKQQSSVDEKQQSYPAYVAYVDEDTFPEGGEYWTRDTRKGTVAIVPAGATTLKLVLHVGPNAGRVAVDIGPIHQEIEMAPDETRDLRTPIAPGTSWLAVAVQASRAFVPADVDSGSDDHRHLGCHVRPQLE